MAHQTGIKPNSELSRVFADAAKPNSKCRFLKVVIESESLVLDDRREVSGDWRSQYDACVKPHLHAKSACYMLYRLDTENAHGYNWLFLHYAHDAASVRDKMLYSGTAATVKKAFGNEHFATDGNLYGTQPEDLTLEGYEAHLRAGRAPPPLTMAEEERLQVREMEKQQAGVDERQQTLAGVAFDCDSGLRQSLKAFADGACDYVQVEIAKGPPEMLRTAMACERLQAGKLAGMVPQDTPRYHLYRHRHEWRGSSVSPIIFIYSAPGFKCPIRERMVYSSGRASFVQLCSNLGIEPARRLEIDGPDEVTEEALMEEAHHDEQQEQLQQQQQQKFQKPRPPGRRPAGKK